MAKRRSAEQVRKQEARYRVPAEGESKQILFGDLHVHTTFSMDAFALSLPLVQGDGAHPPADACDFARYCSALDFWSINDHAEGITPRHWRETVDSIRRCNEIAGDPADPDTVAFLGWEWSQVGETPETHYGHKNVILRGLGDTEIPRRPIAAPPRILEAINAKRPWWINLQIPLRDFANRDRYFDFGKFRRELAKTPDCETGVDTRELPEDCREIAETPRELFEKLAQWDVEALVIPHGTTWGMYTPPTSSLRKQLEPGMHDGSRQTLFEIYSGHGNSEENRSWRAAEGPFGEGASCPEERTDYKPCCVRAGELVREKCLENGGADCDERAQEAERNYVEAGLSGYLTVPFAEISDWLDCGQCPDCFNPAYNYRPGGSGQYALAISRFGEDDSPKKFRFGFIGASDGHSARPGTGYKEFERVRMTEAAGPSERYWRSLVGGDDPDPVQDTVPFDPIARPVISARLWEGERQSSFFMTGGLAAVHAAGRSRDEIWDALVRREVYGTSGDRILLWFDVLNAAGPDGPQRPMGSEVRVGEAPRFRVRAVGAREQSPGCPEESSAALGKDELERICRNECYNPSDARRRIDRIEVIRIRPQTSPGEDVGGLIDDPWKTIPCEPDSNGCAVEFSDPGMTAERREFIYYVRAIQEPTPAVNAGGLRCEYDAAGNCISVSPCYGDYRSDRDDDCLSINEERAWSSPIFVQPH
jgi:hypothetical protein